MNTGQLIIISCFFCSIFTTAGKFCPDESKDICTYMSGSINFIICIYVIFKLFNVL